MKGLELSKQYYEMCGKEIFHTTFTHLMDRVAVGLVGPGSECLGFDDEHSRDHDWGPSFCLWVTQKDFKNHGRDLQECYDALPGAFKGYPPRQQSPGEENRVGVISIDSFYLRYTGLSKPPESIQQWQRIPEVNLSTCTNGKVFYDPLGEFSRWRQELLKFYPNEVVVRKIADCCMHAGQAGQYNWQRGLLRNDPYTVNLAKNNFCTQIIRIAYLINKTFPPFYKWLYKGFKQLPRLAPELSPLLDELLGGDNVFSHSENQEQWRAQQALIQRICLKTINTMKTIGLTDHDSPFLLDHVPHILRHIEDPGVTFN